MKSIGSLVLPLASGQPLSSELSGVIFECKNRAAKDVLELGLLNSTPVISAAETRLMACLNLCESPIEKIVLSTLAFTVVPDTLCFPPAIHDFMSGEEWPQCPFVIVPQFVIARYRLDFLVSIEDKAGKRTFIAIECDGKDFHSNKVARSRDNTRDSYLMGLGIRTLRISGSRISKLREKLSDEFAAILSEKREAA